MAVCSGMHFNNVSVSPGNSPETATTFCTHDVYEVHMILRVACCRTFAFTHLNAHSSRSHAVVMVGVLSSHMCFRLLLMAVL
jgi:hypothetical protein